MNYRQEYEKWLASPALSEDERNELKAIANDEKEIENRFYGPLEFGTAGLRGTMYVGLHNMNRHVIRWATQGFANVIRAEGEEAMKKGVAICMDCRNHSMEFARAAACVMAGNGITVKLFESLRPTPELSFAVREYGCEAGINVTASHNPKEYNGYKVYWSDGAQLPPQHAAANARELEHIDIFTGVTSMDFDEAVNKGLITMLGEDCDKRFMANVMSMVNDYETVKKVADDFKLVYTPFHGCGHKLVPEALTRLGIKHLLCVPEQMVIDGNFPTVVSPNPENPEGFYLAIDLAKKNDVDFILGTDPDSDRVGIMVRNKQGEFEPVTGNQTGVLLLDYLIGAMKRAGKLPANAAALKTIVTTEMARAVAEANGLDCYDTFTGFKFMAEKMNELEGAGKNTVIFSYEESYGYMIGHYVRDKDAVTASLLLTEMAAWYYSQGMTLFDALNALFEKYGWYGEKTHNLVMPGLDGAEKMANLMKFLRETPPSEIGGVKVATYKDYSDGTARDAASGEVTKIALAGSNVLRFELADGTHIVVRPSGTEPKIKVYILTKGADAQTSPNTPPGSTPSPDISQFYQSSRGRRGSRAALFLSLPPRGERMVPSHGNARTLLVHYDRLLPPGLAPAKVRRKIQIRGQAHVAFRLCAGAFDGPAHGRRRGGHVEPRQHRHSGAFCHGADCCGQHARRVRRAKAAAHRPPRPPRRCSRQRSGGCARKGRRLGRENVFYHPADGRCRDAAR